MKKSVIYFIAGLLLAGGLLGWLYFSHYLELEKPQIELKREISFIGKNKKVEITFSDQKSGISHVKLEIVQDEKKQKLLNRKIPSRGKTQIITSLTIDATTANLVDGPATLIISAADYSLFRNKKVLSVPVTIDTKPPQILIFSKANYITQGGTCFIAYRVSKAVETSGIFVNDYFTPGYRKEISGNPLHVVYFALPLEATRENTRIDVYALDEAGNEARTSLPFFIRERKTRKDSVVLDKSFLQFKMPEFERAMPELQGKSHAEIFKFINSQMRKDNDRTIRDICRVSAKKKLWEGAFLRMREAATMAKFGDEREYIIAGKKYGASVHLGIDLASTAQAPIEAANHGIVVFSGKLGIYGNTVIIDHGHGLSSLYAHLSVIETSAGKEVKKGERLGYSGTTGLAGGDHLHFSVLAGGRFVNPLEWWGRRWIENNVYKKIDF
ncbi:MAG TPA: M23 family metallopeptidase [Deltaproteobacteria bacterium]|nr:M23 family metallopeptidase [Deltaproteobacteria bacterium]